MVQVSRETLEAALNEIKRAAVHRDYVHGSARSAQQLVEANEMPAVYYELLGALV